MDNKKDFEKVAAILSLVPELLTSIDAIGYATHASDDIEPSFRVGRVNLKQKADLDSIPGEFIVKERNDEVYPYEISKNLFGVKFFRLVRELPDGVKYVEEENNI